MKWGKCGSAVVFIVDDEKRRWGELHGAFGRISGTVNVARQDVKRR